MKTRRWIKGLSCVVILILCLCMGLPSFYRKAQADDTLSDGTYEISGFLRSASSDQASMGNAAIVKPIQLVAKEGKLTLRMECKPLTANLGTQKFTGYLAKMNYFPEWDGGSSGIETPKGQTGQSVPVESYYKDTYDSYNDPKTGSDEEVKGKLYPHYLNLPVDDKDEEIWVQVYVPVMESIVKGNGLQYARLQLSWDTLKKVSDDTPDLTEESSQKQETSTTQVQKTTTQKKKSTKLNIKKLKDGIYSIQGEMLKTDKETESMANKAFNHKICLTVKKGNYYLTLDFQGLNMNSQFGYLSKMKYFQTGYKLDRYGAPKGTLKNVTVESYQKDTKGKKVQDSFGTNYPDKVTFPLIKEALNQGYVPLQVFVPIMESISPGSGTQSVFLKLDLSSVKAVTSTKVFESTQSSAVKEVQREGSSGASFPQSSGSSEEEAIKTQTVSVQETDLLTSDSASVNTTLAQETEDQEMPIIVPSVLSILASMAGLFYKVKSRGL